MRALLLLLAGLAVAQDVPVRQGPVERDADMRTIDDPAVARTCGDKGAVFVATSATCPLSRKYAPKLLRFQETLGVPVVLVDVAKAPALARTLGVTTTTEAFVLDKERRVVYRGAVDDQYGIGYALAKPRREYLKDAVAAMLAGRPPEVRATTAPGCVVDLDAVADTEAPTYFGRIEDILDANCVECHRTGENAPFRLDDYKTAKAQRDMIGFVVRKRLMPPWFASEKGHAMANDRRLSDEDRRDLLAWVRAGGPQGVAQSRPPTIRQDGWRIDAPDAVYAIPRPFDIPAEGTVEYHHVRVPTGLTEDKWVRGMEIRSSAPQNVHHVLVFLRFPRGHKNFTRRPSDRGGLGGYFAGMVPGQSSLVYPDGLAKKLPAGAILQFQIHYTTNGKAARDITKIGLMFAKEAPRHEVTTTGIFETRFRIPPGAKRHPVVQRIRVPVPIRVLGFMPHMHVRGTAFRYELTLPGKAPEILLDVPRYDFNWQLYYRLAKPLDLPVGAILTATAWYDNSATNPANPDPTRTVRYGEQTWEEMMIGYVDWHRLR